MSPNPVEENFITKFILGLAVLVGVAIGLSAGVWLFGRTGVAYADVVGGIVGAVVVFVGFSIWYARYDAAWSEE